jgi:prepilin-type N-terminal cleavage/methylation domain-containing protein
MDIDSPKNPAVVAFSRRAFTLIELLVVVTIIVLMLALLLPALGKAAREGERVACSSNLHSGSIAMLQYVADNSGYMLPQGSTGPDGAGLPDGRHWWYKVFLTDYLADANVFIDPSDVGWPGGNVSGNKPLYQNYGRWEVSYYLNIAGGGAGDISGRKVTTMNYAPKVVMFCDWPGYAGFSWHNPQTPSNSDVLYNDAMNEYAFVDGHVAYIPTYFVGPSTPDFSSVWSFCYNPPANSKYSYLWSPPN